jgi:N-acetylmuramoyl-L-alanine amidase
VAKQPYVVKQGEYLAQIAYEQDFDADSVWQDSANDEIRKLRPDPNILFGGDVLYVPDKTNTDPKAHSLAIGSLNSFAAPPAPTAKLCIHFRSGSKAAHPSMAFVIEELEELTGLSTDGDGVATIQVPVSLAIATLRFVDTGDRYELAVGHIDPIDTLSGMAQRLTNMGFIPPDVSIDDQPLSAQVAIVRDGLRALRVVRNQPTPPSDAASDPGDAGSEDPHASDETEVVVCESCSDSWSPDDQDPFEGSESGGDGDDAGLTDEGTLTDEARKLLLDAYGC